MRRRRKAAPQGGPVAVLATLCALASTSALAEQPLAERWFGPREWVRDSTGPIVSLGEPGDFDDTHIFAPCVAFEDGEYRLWYSGSSGRVEDRVFRLGLAVSRDGVRFEKDPRSPVYEFGDGKTSVLTATLLRNADGSVAREDGRLRMWFTGADMTTTNPPHLLYETYSKDGIDWDPPSGPQLENIYAPTILLDGAEYRMWYTDVEADPWKFRHASSRDGKNWTVTEEPVVVLDQDWEKGRLFYPAVLKLDGVYLLWYGSYWSEHKNKTALGFAASRDGLAWEKHPESPVFRPDPDRAWESHYTTSQSVLRLPDGRLRMWYATRKAPPFVNKYFALGTAVLEGFPD